MKKSLPDLTSDLSQATNVVATLFTTWAFGIGAPNLRTLGNVSFIVFGVVIASYGEIQFVLIGFICMSGTSIIVSVVLTRLSRPGCRNHL